MLTDNILDLIGNTPLLRLKGENVFAKMQQMRRGEPPNNYVDPADLSRLHRQNLKAAFTQVRTSQQALLNRFHLA